MREVDTRTYLTERVAEAMRSLSVAEARSLAVEITSIVNDWIGGKHSGAVTSSSANSLVPQVLRTYATLSIGWDAFRSVYGNQEHDRLIPARVIGSMPEALSREVEIAESLRRTGVWPGSLFEAIHRLFESARESMIVVAPYWSVDAVQMLMRHVTRASMSGVRISILTQPRVHLSADALKAVLLLRGLLAFKHADVSVYSPYIVGGRAPLIHCKAVVQDDERAYLGSANFTVNGIDQSVELGVILGGFEARSVRSWLTALMKPLECWEFC